MVRDVADDDVFLFGGEDVLLVDGADNGVIIGKIGDTFGGNFNDAALFNPVVLASEEKICFATNFM